MTDLVEKFNAETNRAVLEALANLVEDRSVGAKAIAGLRMVKPTPEEITNVVVPALILGIRRTDKYVRRESAISLAHFGANAAPALPAMIPLLFEKSPDLAGFVIEALAKMGPQAKPAIPALIRFVELNRSEEEDEDCAEGAAIEALGRIGFSQEVQAPLLSMMKHGKQCVSIACAKVFLENGVETSQAIEVITKSLKHDDVMVRRAAAQALWELPSLPPALRSSLVSSEDDSDRVVRNFVSEALKKLDSLKK